VCVCMCVNKANKQTDVALAFLFFDWRQRCGAERGGAANDGAAAEVARANC